VILLVSFESEKLNFLNFTGLQIGGQQPASTSQDSNRSSNPNENPPENTANRRRDDVDFEFD
jgi:hypothetical protein